MRKEAILRIRIITACILVLSMVLIARLYQIQILNHDFYTARAEQQYIYTVQDLYDRGSIYFTNKNGEYFSAGTIKTGYTLAIDPQRIDDEEKTITALSTVVQIDVEEFIKRAKNKERTYVEIDSQVVNEDAEKIKSLGLKGVHLYQNQWRYYPGESLAARTVGFIGYSDQSNYKELSGKYGLERYYDDILNRQNKHLSVNFFAEIFSNFGNIIFDNSKAREGDIVTSIDPRVSGVLQEKLKDIQTEWNSKLTGGIIINPKNGEIYALDAVPTFDLNNKSTVAIENFRNPLVEDLYEMGSIIKPLTMAAGIDAGAVTPESIYYDAGFLNLDTYTIKNYDGKGRGYVNMQEVLNQSLNTGAAYVVTKMGKEKFREYFLNLKLGSETGIDLPNEVYGLVKNLDSPRDVEYATASFGQGIAMTPIETVRALATLANGGVLITPHIARKIVYEDGAEHKVRFPDGQRIFKKETSETISRMLTNVVDDALMGGSVALPNYSVAAKTGTAQIANVDGGGYYEDKFLHSFFGYFPSYDPQFLIFLYTVEPKGVRYASQTLTDPFMELITFLINYYNVVPDR